jgi:hypothetical protein
MKRMIFHDAEYQGGAFFERRWPFVLSPKRDELPIYRGMQEIEILRSDSTNPFSISFMREEVNDEEVSPQYILDTK